MCCAIFTQEDRSFFQDVYNGRKSDYNKNGTRRTQKPGVKRGVYKYLHNYKVKIKNMEKITRNAVQKQIICLLSVFRLDCD